MMDQLKLMVKSAAEDDGFQLPSPIDANFELWVDIWGFSDCVG